MASAIKVNTVSVNQLFTAFWATIVVGNWPLTIKVNFAISLEESANMVYSKYSSLHTMTHILSRLA